MEYQLARTHTQLQRKTTEDKTTHWQTLAGPWCPSVRLYHLILEKTESGTVFCSTNIYFFVIQALQHAVHINKQANNLGLLLLHAFLCD